MHKGPFLAEQTFTSQRFPAEPKLRGKVVAKTSEFSLHWEAYAFATSWFAIISSARTSAE